MAASRSPEYQPWNGHGTHGLWFKNFCIECIQPNAWSAQHIYNRRFVYDLRGLSESFYNVHGTHGQGVWLCCERIKKAECVIWLSRKRNDLRRRRSSPQCHHQKSIDEPCCIFCRRKSYIVHWRMKYGGRPLLHILQIFVPPGKKKSELSWVH